MVQNSAPHGFIGIGLMGGAMAEQLLVTGHKLVVWNLEPENLTKVVSMGAVAADSPKSVAEQCDIVLVCVLDTAAVESVVFGPNGIAQAAGAGKVLVDHSTTDPVATQQMAKRLRQETGMGWVDAPVSGGPAFAKERRLTIMAGGEEADIAAILPVMKEYAANFTHMGPVGAGQITKVINQAICGVSYVLMAEAASLAERSGIEASKIPECLRGGHADSTMLQFAYPKMVKRDFDPPLALSRAMLKDLKAVLSFSEQFDLELPLVSEAVHRFAEYNEQGGAMKEISSIYYLYNPDLYNPDL
jgi:3-hydroxyisobutyrate dehydrogenase